MKKVTKFVLALVGLIVLDVLTTFAESKNDYVMIPVKESQLYTYESSRKEKREPYENVIEIAKMFESSNMRAYRYDIFKMSEFKSGKVSSLSIDTANIVANILNDYVYCFVYIAEDDNYMHFYVLSEGGICVAHSY